MRIREMASEAREASITLAACSTQLKNKALANIAGALLNNKNEITDSMAEELDRIEAFVEQVLFYSRSNAVEKDYIIREIDLKKLCYDVLKKNSGLFIRKNIGVKAEKLDVTVLSDAKWLEFILGQILVNSIKYSRETNAVVELSTVIKENSIVLSIKDNGIGIRNAELARIFEKGFTGTNGREKGSSTGMGLYICRKLCGKLGLEIKAESKYGEGMKISIIFPKSSMMDAVRD
jgi:signal transduction histidine kinase